MLRNVAAGLSENRVCGSSRERIVQRDRQRLALTVGRHPAQLRMTSTGRDNFKSDISKRADDVRA